MTTPANRRNDPRFRWIGRTLRTRLFVWKGIVIAACLLAYSLAVGVSFTSHVGRDLDRRVHEDIELAARAVVVDAQGNPAWPGGFLGKQIAEEEGGGHWVEVWDDTAQRRLVAGTFDPGLKDAPTLHPKGVAHTHETSHGPVRVMWQPVDIDGRRFVIRAAVSELSARQQVRSLWIQLGSISLAVLILGGIGGIAIAHHVLQPLVRMAAHARRITAEQLHERLEVAGSGEELEQLGEAFNDTLARLESSFTQLKRFTADASHEIRTPLTALRSAGEVALQGNKSGAEYREVIGTMLEETDRLARLSEELLTIARAEAGQTHHKFEDLDLRQLADEVVDQLGVLAEERGQSIGVEGASTVARVDRFALRQAIVNLVDNAIKYSPEGASVKVRVARTPEGTEIAVEDNGPGIPSEHTEKIFDRFYRIDPSRSRELGGTGLGLSLVKLAVDVHEGRVDVESTVGQGTTFRITIPSRPDSGR